MESIKYLLSLLYTLTGSLMSQIFMESLLCDSHHGRWALTGNAAKNNRA